MEKTITELLILAGITRQEFADLCGISLKTTYWSSPPGYAIIILEQKIELREYRQLRIVFKRLMK